MKIHDHTTQWKRKGVTIASEVSSVTPGLPSRGPCHAEFCDHYSLSLLHSVIDMVVLQTSYTRYCLVFPAFDLTEMEPHCVCFSVTCFFHSRLCFWDLSIWCVHTDFFGLTPTSLRSLYIMLIQKQTRLYFLSPQLALHIGIQQRMAAPQLLCIWRGSVPSFCCVNSAAVNVTDLVCWCARAKVYPENTPRRGTAGSRVCECSAVRDTAARFSEGGWSDLHSISNKYMFYLFPVLSDIWYSVL